MFTVPACSVPPCCYAGRCQRLRGTFVLDSPGRPVFTAHAGGVILFVFDASCRQLFVPTVHDGDCVMMSSSNGNEPYVDSHRGVENTS